MVIYSRSQRKNVVPVFHKKAFLPALCVSLCLCGGMVPGVSAAALPDPPGQGEITPYALFIRGKSLTFDISAGVAAVNGWVTGQTGVADRCRIVVELQEKSGSSWETVATWSDESDGRRASVSETKTVTAGRTYRAKAEVTAWSGDASETQTILSSEKKA